MSEQESASCHTPNYHFTSSWDVYGYDASTNMHWVVSYYTDYSGHFYNVTVTLSPFGSTPHEFSYTTPTIDIDGDNIIIHTTSSQTYKTDIGPTTLNNTTVTDWAASLNTCAQTVYYTYTTY
jgi:hypothetical protein